MYKYYYCPHCQKRINESFVLEQFLLEYPKWERKTHSNNYLISLRNSVKALKKEIEVLDKFYEDGDVLVDDYIDSLRELERELKLKRKEYRKHIGGRKSDWSQLSEDEKQHLVASTVEIIKVNPGPIGGGAEVEEIRFRDDLPVVRKSTFKRE